MVSADVEAKKTKRCMKVADEVFKLFERRNLSITDGIFTMTHIVAKAIQSTFDTPEERELTLQAMRQIIERTIVALDDNKQGLMEI